MQHQQQQSHNAEHIVIVKVPGIIFKRKQGFAFDMRCWEKLCHITQLAPDEWQYMESANFINQAIYAAALSYNTLIEKPVNFDIKKVKKWMDDTNRIELGRIIEAMTKSRVGGKELGEFIEEYIVDIHDNSDEKKK